MNTTTTNKRKLHTAAPPPSRRLRSTLPRRRRQRFSPFRFGEVPTSKIKLPGDESVVVELSDCSCVLSYSVAEASRNGGSEMEKKVEFAGIEDSSKFDSGASDFAGNAVVSMNSSMSNRRGNGGVVESASDSVKQNVKNAKFCDVNDECEVESAVIRSKVNEGTSDLAGSTIVSTNSVMSNRRGNGGGVKQNEKNSKFYDECEVESEITSLSKFSAVEIQKPKEIENDLVSVDSVKFCNEETESAVDGVQSFPETIVAEFDLECSESFENSSQQSHSYSSAYSSIYFESSELENLSEEFTPSTWFDSGSQFSEKSSTDGSPSLTFQLLNQFTEQFYKTSLVEKSSKLVANEYSDDINLLGLEDEEDEESYRMLKSRERRQLYLRDYAAEYCSNDYGHLIIEQRLEMVHWIFEHSTNMELQHETMFLGINLLDRFLSKGYFKSKRSLQIAGISCLTLAARLEENQPYNSIRQKTFYVGNTAYTRCEVVAMEWLVQEVLNFQCFLPTMYNFLWFYLKAARANDAVEKTVRYLATLALLGHDQMCYWPSTVAASLVIIACKAAETDAHCHLLIESHSREKNDTLPECIKRLEFLVKYC